MSKHVLGGFNVFGAGSIFTMADNRTQLKSYDMELCQI